MIYLSVRDGINSTYTIYKKNRWLWGLLFWTLLFLVCVLVSFAPLQRFASAPLLASLPVSRLLTFAGAWLPENLLNSKSMTGNGEFLVLIALSFVLYGICVWIVRYRLTEVKYARALILILIGAAIAGLLFVFAPALPSHDVFVYADYGRAIVAHGANPYFVPSSLISPHDPITRLDGWNSVPAAYGPLWLAVCSAFALFLGDNPVRYIFAFRLLGLVVHLLNTLLVIGILRVMGRSRRTVTLGALLYAYNPLVLMESCLGPHNDALMVTFMLSGIWFALRTTRLTTLRGYFWPILMTTFAVLIKFTSAPLILFFVWLIVRKTLLEAGQQVSWTARWSSAFIKVVLAGLVSGVTVILFYGPFWIGHSISAIARSFTSPPSSSFAENSILRVFIEWVKRHGLPPRTALTYHFVYVLSQHPTWNVINMVTLLGALLIGGVLLWCDATMQNVIVATLFTLEAILVVTPWFYSWYVLWIVGLAIVLLGSGRANRAFIAFALVFSASAFFTYLDPSYLPSLPVLGDLHVGRVILTIAPPLIVFFYMWLPDHHGRRAIPIQGDE